MPNVGGKKFDYTPAGRAAAKKYKKRMQGGGVGGPRRSPGRAGVRRGPGVAGPSRRRRKPAGPMRKRRGTRY